MTKKQIEKKAEELGIKYQTPCHGVGDCEFEARQAATEMADWVLSHQWVSVKDELPPQKERYSKYVIMRNRIGGNYIGCYDFVAEKWLDGHLEDIYMDVTHWMPIPPLAKKGGEE